LHLDRSKQRMSSSKYTRPDVEPFEVRAHHLLCAICVAGGCDSPPAGRYTIGRLMRALWRYPYVSLKITADIDLNRVHYLDIYADRGRRTIPKDFERRRTDYVGRRKDLEALRRLGIAPNTVLPAYLVYTILLRRAPTLKGICRSSSPASAVWPECPHARKGYYEKITSERNYSSKELAELGEALDGKGMWAILRLRTREDMRAAKATSANMIRKADRLFIRPHHLLCILCTADVQEPLMYDNLVELRERMRENPNILVTLTEGCCMVCDPCFEYHKGENICIRTHIKDQLRDLMLLEKLDMKPGDTLTAKEIYKRVYARIGSLYDVCAWGDKLDTAPFWSPCDGWKGDKFEQARRTDLLAKDKERVNATQCRKGHRK